MFDEVLRSGGMTVCFQVSWTAAENAAARAQAARYELESSRLPSHTATSIPSPTRSALSSVSVTSIMTSGFSAESP